MADRLEEIQAYVRNCGKRAQRQGYPDYLSDEALGKFGWLIAEVERLRGEAMLKELSELRVVAAAAKVWAQDFDPTDAIADEHERALFSALERAGLLR